MATMYAYARDNTRVCSRPYAQVLAVKKLKILIKTMRKTKTTKKSGTIAYQLNPRFVKEGRLRALGRQNSRFYAPHPEGF